MKQFLLFSISCLFSLQIFAQIPQTPTVRPLKVMLHVADSCYEISNFYGAHQAYKKVLDAYPDKQDPAVAFKCAEACRLYQNYAEAENYYKVTISLDTVGYPLAYYWYAEMLKFQGKYKPAAKAFKDYLTDHKKGSDYNNKKAEHEVVICADSVEKIKNDEDINLVRIPENSVNSRYSEYAPYQHDDTVLFFSGIRPYNQKVADTSYDFRNYFTKVYKSTFTDSVWQVAQEVSGVNADRTHTGNLTFGFRNEEVFFSRCELKEKYYCNIFRADYSGGKIKNAEILPEPINKTGFNTTNPRWVITGDAQYLFFVSDRAGGSGMKDIWYSKRKSDGSFDQPQNCGTNVNTFGDEVTPYYDHRDSLLFFSSETHNSLGGFDVFSSKGDLTKNVWESAKNVGTPINSSYNDMYYHYAPDSTTALFVSNRTESTKLIDEAHSNDIYYYKLVRRSIERISELVPIELFFDNDQPNPGTLDTVTDFVFEDLFLAYMDRKEEYIKQNIKGQPNETEQYYTDIVNEFFTNNVEKGWTKLFMFSELMEVILADGYDIIVTFKGYASPLGNTIYNERIAKRRIDCVNNYFETFKDGVFVPFQYNEPETGKGSIRYMQVPLGETVAEGSFKKNGQTINSDELEDRKNVRRSVYSPAAALQRKIEILAVEIEEKAELEAQIAEELRATKKEATLEEAVKYGLVDTTVKDTAVNEQIENIDTNSTPQPESVEGQENDVNSGATKTEGVKPDDAIETKQD